MTSNGVHADIGLSRAEAPGGVASGRLDGTLRQALDGLLLSMADDELVLGFSDSEWTGIAPLLEEDVAMSSLSQDELGHAAALFGLLAELRDDGSDADAIAYDREPPDYRHARLLDHGRGDWAMTIARRFLYDTADGDRLAGLESSSFEPLRNLVAKIRREERYHVMHATTWLQRLATHPGEPRERLVAAFEVLAGDAATVFTPLPGEGSLVDAGVLAAPMASLEARWRASIDPTLERLGLPAIQPAVDSTRGRLDHSAEFRNLHEEMTSVRRLEPGAVW